MKPLNEIWDDAAVVKPCIVIDSTGQHALLKTKVKTDLYQLDFLAQETETAYRFKATLYCLGTNADWLVVL